MANGARNRLVHHPTRYRRELGGCQAHGRRAIGNREDAVNVDDESRATAPTIWALSTGAPPMNGRMFPLTAATLHERMRSMCNP